MFQVRRADSRLLRTILDLRWKENIQGGPESTKMPTLFRKVLDYKRYLKWCSESPQPLLNDDLSYYTGPFTSGGYVYRMSYLYHY